LRRGKSGITEEIKDIKRKIIHYESTIDIVNGRVKLPTAELWGIS
jgi:hypothetical protein